MSAWIISSSALVLAVVVLRALLGRHISARMRYALWLVVLVRLVVPGTLFQSSISVMNAAEPAMERIQLQEYHPYITLDTQKPAQQDTSPKGTDEAGNTAVLGVGTASPTVQVPAAHTGVNIEVLLPRIWLCSGIAVGLWFVFVNLRFYGRLKASRREIEYRQCRLKVYVAEGLSSPCLFGFVHPAIYLNAPAIASDKIDHVVTHEYEHWAHGDNWWSAARCLCLAIWWWNPLVWLAAVLSRSDGEVACDEAVLQDVGGDGRLSYGNTLLGLITVKGPAWGLSRTSTSMTSGKREMKTRLNAIVKRPRVYISAVVAVALLMTAFTGCAFTGAKGEKETDAPEAAFDMVPLTDEELDYFSGKFFNDTENMESVIRNNIVNDTFDQPEDVNLYQMFYCGTGEAGDGGALTQNEVSALGYNSEICPVDRLSETAMDKVLMENMGITLGKTSGRGLGLFDYLAQTHSYYHPHGDTNYQFVDILEGYKYSDKPDTLYLRRGDPYGGKMAIITLSVQSDGSYRFLSNVISAGYDNGVYLTGEQSTENMCFTADYADDKWVIFHGTCGLFLYDTSRGYINDLMDFKDAFGCIYTDKGFAIKIQVSDDGEVVQCALDCDEAFAVQHCVHPETSCRIRLTCDDPDSSASWITENKTPAYDDLVNVAGSPEVKFSGDTIETLKMTVGSVEYMPFERWVVKPFTDLSLEAYGLEKNGLTPQDYSKYPLEKLLAVCAASDGAVSESCNPELYKRFLSTPDAVLGAIAVAGYDGEISFSAQKNLCIAIGGEAAMDASPWRFKKALGNCDSNTFKLLKDVINSAYDKSVEANK